MAKKVNKKKLNTVVVDSSGVTRYLNKPSKVKDPLSYRIFTVFNYIILTLLSLACFLPILYVLARSFSHDVAIQSGKVFLWPVNIEYVKSTINVRNMLFIPSDDLANIISTKTIFHNFSFNTEAYTYLILNSDFWHAFAISIQRVIMGTSIQLFFCVILAYPLSQDSETFMWRGTYVWFFFTTMLFGGGMIPGYFVQYSTGLIDTVWAFIVPGCVPIGNAILMLNFFRGLPKELDEAAFMDGAGHWTILFKIYVPTSLPSLATIALFTLVGHWNDWFSGLLLMNNPKNYPLQTYLQTVIKDNSSDVTDQEVLDRTGQGNSLSKDNIIAAQIFIGAAPILMVYPFLQKYFAKGIVLGSVKG